MDQFTYELLKKKYRKLISQHKELNGFRDQDEFIGEFEGCRAEPGDFETRVSRCDAFRGFEPENVQLARIESDYDLAKCHYPAL